MKQIGKEWVKGKEGVIKVEVLMRRSKGGKRMVRVWVGGEVMSLAQYRNVHRAVRRACLVEGVW